MNYTTPLVGSGLFERILEIINREELKSSERIPKLRTVQESLFKELTVDEHRYFPNLHAREVYIFKTYTIPYNLKQEIKSLRLYSNKVVHGDSIVNVSVENEATCIKTLCETISYFTRSAIPSEIKIKYENKAGSFDIVKKKFAERLSVFLIIEAISYHKEREIYDLVCENEDLGQITLRIYSEKKRSKI